MPYGVEFILMSEKSTGKTAKKNVSSAVNRRKYLKLASMAGTTLGTGFGATTFSSKLSTPASAATTIIDDFEDGDLSEYDSDPDYASQGSITSSPTYNGSYALTISDKNTELISTSGLDNYPGAGDTFRFWVRATGGADNLNVSWGVQDHDNRYYAKLKPASGDFYLFKYKSESGDYRDGDTSISLSQDTWYEIEVNWGSSGTQTVTLYNSDGSQLAQLSMSDSEWSSGGIGYDAYLSTGESVYFDYVTIGSGGSWSPEYKVVDNFEPPVDLNSTYDFNKGSSYATAVKDDTADYNGSNTLAPSYDGEGLLQHSGGDVEMFSLPGNGLTNHPSAGDTFSCYILSENGTGDAYIAYGVQDTLQDFYWANVDFTNQRVYLFKRVNSDSTSIDGTQELSINSDKWYYLKIHWQTDGTHEIYLYDINENIVGELTANDSEFSDGGIGFITYPGNSSEKFYYDSFINGEHRKDSTGGWGPDELVSGGRYDVADEGFSGLPGDPTEDYRFFFSNGGYQSDEQHLRFTIGALGKNFYNGDPTNDTPSESAISPFFNIDGAGFKVEVTKDDGSTIDNSSSIVGDDGDLLTRPSNLTYVTFADSETTWNDWEDQYWGTRDDQEIIKEAAVNSGLIDATQDRPSWFDTLGLAWGGLTLITSPVGSTVISATLLTVSGVKWVRGMVQEANCGSNYFRPNNLASTIDGNYDFCDGVPLAGYIATFDIDYSDVPDGQDLGLEIKQNFARAGNTYDDVKATATWNASIPGDTTVPYIELNEKNLK